MSFFFVSSWCTPVLVDSTCDHLPPAHADFFLGVIACPCSFLYHAVQRHACFTSGCCCSKLLALISKLWYVTNTSWGEGNFFSPERYKLKSHQEIMNLEELQKGCFPLWNCVTRSYSLLLDRLDYFLCFVLFTRWSFDCSSLHIAYIIIMNASGCLGFWWRDLRQQLRKPEAVRTCWWHFKHCTYSKCFILCVCSGAKLWSLKSPEARPPALDMLKLKPDFSGALQHHLHLHQAKCLGSYLESAPSCLYNYICKPGSCQRGLIWAVFPDVFHTVLGMSTLWKTLNTGQRSPAYKQLLFISSKFQEI